MTYRAPVDDIRFALEAQAGFGALRGAFPDCEPALVDSVLEEAARFHEGVVAPLNRVGDMQPPRLGPEGVTAAPGFGDALARYAEAGWMGLGFPVAWGGAGLPRALSLAVFEMTHSASMAFGLCPMLSLAAVEALLAHGTDAQKATYLPALVSGRWTGTMNLTESQAGSDVGALRTRAEPQPDGSYRLFGQKIFITWGDHDAAENIVHLILARLPDAPEGSRGVSLFIAPKFLPGPDGRPGRRNDIRAVGLEHKLGIHGSPTCVMAFGDTEGAWAELIGEPNKGLACMFTMMNSARLNVGLEGVAIAERAWQQALAYAHARRQGRAPGSTQAGASAIVDHPDVRRMLAGMKARIQAGRAICYATAVAADLALHAGDDEARARARRREDILTPIAKAWCTDMGVAVASEAVQVHGGMGFIEETGAAQHYRDARIAPIYEGTNGIQAIDLVGRKLAMDGGLALLELCDDILAIADACRREPALSAEGARLAAGAGVLRETGLWLRSAMAAEPVRALAGATPFLKLAGDVVGAGLLARGALAAGEGDRARLFRHFARTDLATGLALADAITGGASDLQLADFAAA